MGEGRLEPFQKRILGRLRNWREEDHKADRLLNQLSSQRSRRLEIALKDPLLKRKPLRKGGLEDVSARHDKYLYGKKRERDSSSKQAHWLH